MADGWADLSRCERYRYALGRRWDDGPEALFVLLNPSTADAAVDDPTLRRCMGFARREGCGATRTVNLFAWRATDPRDLARAEAAGEDIVGRRNATAIREAMATCKGPVIAGWGAQAIALPRVAPLLRLAGERKISCLGMTKAGHPRHPLYLRTDAPMIAFTG